MAPEDDYVTVASLIMRPDDGELLLTRGNPCEADYERLSVDELVARARAGRRLPVPRLARERGKPPAVEADNRGDAAVQIRSTSRGAARSVSPAWSRSPRARATPI